mmetsp:Transcript_54339/g.157787  ORF Transcript_54339/g.157787 Transcript_54339/m.157787 type:complete len:234 (-) Transcript_54339:821-1522(-)
MASVSSEIASFRALICVFLLTISSFVTLRSSSHHFLWVASFWPSAASKSIIFWISWRTTAKGFSARNIEAMRRNMDEPCVSAAFWRNSCAAFRRGAASKPVTASATAKAPARWRRTAERRSCTRRTPPTVVASTVPKVSKAASLLRMAMASDKAASSFMRNWTRSSYCFFFAAHMSRSFWRKSTASSLAMLASSSCPRFVARSPSLPPRWPCFRSYESFKSSWAACISAMYLS